MKVFLNNEPTDRGEQTPLGDKCLEAHSIFTKNSVEEMVVWVVQASFREAILKRDRDEKARIVAGMKINLGLRADASLNDLLFKIREINAE